MQHNHDIATPRGLSARAGGPAAAERPRGQTVPRPGRIAHGTSQSTESKPSPPPLRLSVALNPRPVSRVRRPALELVVASEVAGHAYQVRVGPVDLVGGLGVESHDQKFDLRAMVEPPVEMEEPWLMTFSFIARGVAPFRHAAQLSR